MDKTKPSNDSIFALIFQIVQTILLVAIIITLVNVRESIVNLSTYIITQSGPASSMSSGQLETNNTQEISVDDDPFIGEEEAPITLVMFSDFECPYCKDAYELIKNLVTEYPSGTVKFVYRDYPLIQTHPLAFKSAMAANCALDQNKYWEMSTLLFENQSYINNEVLQSLVNQLNMDSDKFSDCMSSNKYESEIYHDIEDGLSYGVIATPTVFVNKYAVVGGSIDQIKYFIDIILNTQ